MKKLILTLCLLLGMTGMSFAANSITLNDYKLLYRNWTMSFDSAGVQCVEITPFAYIYVAVDETTDGATYDVEVASTSSPNETGESDDVDNGSDLTADEIFVGTIAAPYLCVRLDTCSTCAVSVTVQVSGGNQ